jgi:hypothetical protein
MTNTMGPPTKNGQRRGWSTAGWIGHDRFASRGDHHDAGQFRATAPPPRRTAPAGKALAGRAPVVRRHRRHPITPLPPVRCGLTVETCCRGRVQSSRCGSRRTVWCGRPPSGDPPTMPMSRSRVGGATSDNADANAAAHPEPGTGRLFHAVQPNGRDVTAAWWSPKPLVRVRILPPVRNTRPRRDVNFVNSTADSMRCTRPSALRCRRSGHQSGARELVNPSALGTEDTAFDSPVPDAWVARHWCAGLLGRQLERGSTPWRSTMPFKLNRLSVGVKSRRCCVRIAGRAPWTVV